MLEEEAEELGGEDWGFRLSLLLRDLRERGPGLCSVGNPTRAKRLLREFHLKPD